MQTTSGDIWDEIEAVITPFGKDNQEAGSDAEFSVSFIFDYILSIRDTLYIQIFR
jgi:hypothetical protein